MLYYLHRFSVELWTAQLLPSLYLTANAAQVALVWEPSDSSPDLNKYFKGIVLFCISATTVQDWERLRHTTMLASYLRNWITECDTRMQIMRERVFQSQSSFSEVLIKGCKINEAGISCASVCISFKVKNVTLHIHKRHKVYPFKPQGSYMFNFFLQRAEKSVWSGLI